MDLILPFSIEIQSTEGMSPDEVSFKCRQLWQQQQAINALLNGEITDDQVYDLLAESGINPHEWAEQSISNIEFITGERF